MPPSQTPAKTKRSVLSNAERLELDYYLRLARECDNAVLRLYRQGKVAGGAYTGAGNEATAVVVQGYKSDSLKSNSTKTFKLVKVGDKWLIKQERVGG